MRIKIGAVQAQDIQNDVAASLRVITRAMEQADQEGIDLLCFPECFLQGYTLDDSKTKERAVNLVSDEFRVILDSLAAYKATAILGLIEEDVGGHYNTAVVIRRGVMLGAYRKVHLFEENFRPGTTCPAFKHDDVTFGVNICYDARFSEGAAELAQQDAKIIFYPLNNRLPTEKAATYRDKHVPNLVRRAQESGCWVVSADVIAQDETHIGYGCTAIIDPDGVVVSRVNELTSGLATATIAV